MQDYDQGRFIVFEGVEGVGKSTQLKHLQQWLETQNQDVVVTREPGGTPLAESIRELVLMPREESMCAETELLLMMAARLQHWHGFIQPQLAQGKWVLCDRFIDSSVAYQGAGRGLSQDFIRQLHTMIASQMIPDLVIVLDMSIQDSQNRVRQRGQALDRMEQASADFFVRARESFQEAVRLAPARYISIDASESIEAIAAQIQQQISHRFLR